MKKKISKIETKYIVEIGEEVFEYETLEQAERRLKSAISGELESYLIKKEYINGKLSEEILLG